MIDFNNLTDDQKAFFNELWEQHQQQGQHEKDSTKSFEAYIAQRRKQEENQAKAAEILKTKMV